MTTIVVPKPGTLCVRLGSFATVRAEMKSELPRCSEEHDYSCERPRVQYADGGRYVRLSFALSPAAEWNAEMFYRHPEGRGKCKGFSFGSRRRMLAKLNCVSVAAALPYFVTATLPDDVFHDDVGEFAKRAKVWMDTFVKRLRRRVPGAAGFWRIEWQSRKSGRYEGKLFPHFHLLVWGLPERNLGERVVLVDGEERGSVDVIEAYVPLPDNQLSLQLLDALSSPTACQEATPLGRGQVRIEVASSGAGDPGRVFQGDWRFVKRCQQLHAKCVASVDGSAHLESSKLARNMSFQDWASLAWYHVVDSHNTDHLKAGLRVERVRTWGGVMAYCAKYMAKQDCGFMSEISFGRSWGIFNRACVPWAKMVELNLDTDVGVRLRRVARHYLSRRLGKRRNMPYGFTLFCDVQQFKKLWERPPPDPF